MEQIFKDIKKFFKRLSGTSVFIIPAVGVSAGLLIILGIFQVIGGNQTVHPNDINFPSIFIGEDRKEIKVEIADTPDEWEKGLMFRTELPENQGMIFIFPSENFRSFWMKDTYIPLDIIFINSNGKIINFFENAEPLNLEKGYTSREKAKYVLELNGGSVKSLKIKEGDFIDLNEI